MNHISRTADALENGLRLFTQIFKNKTHNKFSKKNNRSKHHTTKETNQAFKLPEIRSCNSEGLRQETHPTILFQQMKNTVQKYFERGPGEQEKEHLDTTIWAKGTQ